MANRREFMTSMGHGLAGIALADLLRRDSFGNSMSEVEHQIAHHIPKAKQVIWVFLSGGYSQMETFDPKPALTTYAGKTYAETPYPNPFENPLFRARSRDVVGGDRLHANIFPLQVGFAPRGESGIEISDWWPHLSKSVDDIAFVRSMYTTDNDHAAEFQMHTGRHKLDEKQPTIGSWISHGLGSLNENLPQFVFLGRYTDMRVKENFAPDYLGPSHAGIEISLDPKKPLAFGERPANISSEEQAEQFQLTRKLNELASESHPDDEMLKARIQAYELAFRMQRSVPDAIDLSSETEETLKLYGIDNPVTEVAGRRLLAAKRLAERGVRYTLAYISDYGEWDSHNDLKNLHARSCERVDKPIAGLLADLKRTGLWDETVVVFCTEFGRTPAVEVRNGNKNPTGRDHHPHAFTVWLAGAGVKRGVVHGATDELGFHVIESPHYVTDLHATVLHLLGIDSRRLQIPGRKRLEIDYGTPIREILS